MSDISEVTPRSLADDAVVLDVREPYEFEAGHAPNAVCIPLGQLPVRLSEVPDETPLAVICRVGVRSMTAAQFLSERGIEAVNVAGGIVAWFDAGKPLVSENGEAPGVV